MKTLAEIRDGLAEEYFPTFGSGAFAEGFDAGAKAVMEQAQRLIWKLEKIALEDDDNKDFARSEDEAQYYIDTAKDALEEWQEFVEGVKK